MTDIIQIGSITSISLLYHITSIHFRLRVVSNFGDGDCGVGEIHTRARKFEETRREGSAENQTKFSALPSGRVSSKFRARVCISSAPQSPSPKLATTRSLIHFNLGNITYTEMDIYSTIISTRTTISLNAILSSIFCSFRKTPLSLLFKTVLSCFWMSAGLFHGGVHERGESTTKYNFKRSVYYV